MVPATISRSIDSSTIESPLRISTGASKERGIIIIAGRGLSTSRLQKVANPVFVAVNTFEAIA